MLPKDFAWLEKEPGPRMLKEALALYGTAEIAGVKSNAIILSWAKATGLSKIYTNDDIPWCGLFMAYVAYRSGCSYPVGPLAAKNWLNFGVSVKTAMLADVLVFARPGGNHVGQYIAENETHYWVLGGNQSDQVCIKTIPKNTCIGIRRQKQAVRPANVRQIFLNLRTSDAGKTKLA